MPRADFGQKCAPLPCKLHDHMSRVHLSSLLYISLYGQNCSERLSWAAKTIWYENGSHVMWLAARQPAVIPGEKWVRRLRRLTVHASGHLTSPVIPSSTGIKHWYKIITAQWRFQSVSWCRCAWMKTLGMVLQCSRLSPAIDPTWSVHVHICACNIFFWYLERSWFLY